ncbi:hypothetical protein DBO86_01475 [Pseudomonas indoloxydans]|uniref:Uncharacterized protein n=1 Tax=Ectopseudomonas oleovorans TaxID=301 RepID=A0A2T5PSP2_ECTOL|nr:hypothetical protein [Pseudomonas indoloxydans]PTU80759.1 hypothetical protein DBO86_01475 [Pseudomonas indoloxydans]
MTLLRCLACLFIFIGVLAGTSAVVLVIVLLLRFPLLLLTLVFACGVFTLVLRHLSTHSP